MYQCSASALEEAATWLQGVSQAVPVSQLSFIAWLMFVITGSISLKSVFKFPEQ